MLETLRLGQGRCMVLALQSPDLTGNLQFQGVEVALVLTRRHASFTDPTACAKRQAPPMVDPTAGGLFLDFARDGLPPPGLLGGGAPESLRAARARCRLWRGLLDVERGGCTPFGRH